VLPVGWHLSQCRPTDPRRLNRFLDDHAPKIIASRSTKELSVWFEVRSRIAAKCQTKPINHVLIAIAPGMRIVAIGRKTSVVNAEEKFGIAVKGRVHYARA
jgi:hypothetical protein